MIQSSPADPHVSMKREDTVVTGTNICSSTDTQWPHCVCVQIPSCLNNAAFQRFTWLIMNSPELQWEEPTSRWQQSSFPSSSCVCVCRCVCLPAEKLFIGGSEREGGGWGVLLGWRTQKRRANLINETIMTEASVGAVSGFEPALPLKEKYRCGEHLRPIGIQGLTDANGRI